MEAIAATAGPTAAPLERARAVQAGMQFEAVLLNTALGSLEHSFSHLPGGKEEDHASEGYSSMAMQALTSGMARSGGMGIGKIITEALLRNSVRGHPVAGAAAPTPGPDVALKDF